MPIICDTNIWYRIADGRINSKDIEGKPLVATSMNAYEFCGTHNALRSYGLFRGAVKAYKDCSTKIAEDPTEYIKMISGHRSIIPKWKKMNDALDIVVSTGNYMPTEGDRQKYIEFDNQTKDSLKPFLGVVEAHRGLIKNRGIYKKRMGTPEIRYAHKETTKEVLMMLSGGLVLDWDKLELFLNTFDEWLRQLSIQYNLTMTSNDWNDLMSLAYVQPGSLYWTYDEKKTKAFIRNIGLGHYLY